MTPDSNEGDEGSPPTFIELSSEQRSKIGGLLDRWNMVQGRLKQAEQISRVAVVPAINELRYAGRMLVAALSNTHGDPQNGLPPVDDAIVIAEQYLTNAEHDISDALIYFFQEKADDLNHRFGAQAIQEKHPEYGLFLQSLHDARNLIVKSRVDLSVRKENYAAVVECTKIAAEHYFELVDAEVLFALEVAHYRARITLWKAVSSAAAAIASSAILFYFLS